MLKQQKEAEKEIEKLKERISELSSDKSNEDVKHVNGTPVLIKRVDVESPAA